MVAGYGTFLLKKTLSAKEASEILKTAPDKVRVNITNELFEVTNESENDWEEIGIKKFLDALAPYISEGCMEYYCDEDGGTHWRYDFDKEKGFLEQIGHVYYTSKDMIEVLKNEGYEISKREP